MRSSDVANSGSRRANHRLLAGGLVAALGLALVIVLAPFIPGLLGAPILAVVFTPLYRKLARRIRSAAAAGLTIGAAILLVLIPGGAIGILLMREVPRVLAGADLSSLFTRLSALEFHGIAIGAGVAALGRAAATWASQQAFAIAGSATRAGVNLVIAFFGLYYVLVSGELAWRALATYSPFSRATTERLRVKFRSVTKATLLGIGLGSLVQAVVIGTGFAITGLPDPLLWGAVTGIVSVLPMVGASIVWVSGTIALLAAHRLGAAIVLLLIGGVISAHVENFIRPIVSHRVSKIHPLITLVGAFAGIRYIGLPGVLLGPLALAYFFELLRAFELEFLGTPTRALDHLG